MLVYQRVNWLEPIDPVGDSVGICRPRPAPAYQSSIHFQGPARPQNWLENAVGLKSVAWYSLMIHSKDHFLELLIWMFFRTAKIYKHPLKNISRISRCWDAHLSIVWDDPWLEVAHGCTSTPTCSAPPRPSKSNETWDVNRNSSSWGSYILAQKTKTLMAWYGMIIHDVWFMACKTIWMAWFHLDHRWS